jgi:hypothetical protein
MRPFNTVVLFALLSLTPALIAGAQSNAGVPLTQVASESNLTYHWLVATRALQLSGPGIVLVIRPGDNLYDVNDRVEVTAEAPRYVSNDLYVSRALANHLTHLARQAQQLLASQDLEAASEAGQAQDAMGGELHGTIVLNVAPLEGAEALLVTGQAPPSASVMITLLATLSADIPNVVLSRHNLTAEPDGKFQAIVPIAPDYMRDSFIHVLATSSPGVISASAQLLVQAPNKGLTVPGATFPGGIW